MPRSLRSPGNVTARALETHGNPRVRDALRPSIRRDRAGLPQAVHYPYEESLRRPAEHKVGFVAAVPALADPLLGALIRIHPGSAAENTVERTIDAIRFAIIPFLQSRKLARLAPEALPPGTCRMFVDWMEADPRARSWSRRVRKVRLALLHRLLTATGRCPQLEKLVDFYGSVDEDVEHRQPPTSAALTALVQAATRDAREMTEMRAALDDEGHPYRADPVKGKLIALAAELRERHPGIPPRRDWLRANDVKFAIKLNKISYRRVIGIYCPSASGIIPLAILMAAYFRLDGQLLSDLSRNSDRLERTVGPERVVIDVEKRRGGQALTPSYPADETRDNPKQLIKLIKAMTEPLVAYAAPSDRHRLFLMRHKDDPTLVVTFAHKMTLFQALSDYCERNGVDNISSSLIRRGVLDLVALLSGSDPAIKAVAAGHTTPRTGRQYYTSYNEDDAADERLAAIRQVSDRARRTGGIIDGTDRLPGEDVLAATPGWDCDSPYAGPPGYRPTRGPCEAYGMCAICDHGKPRRDDPRSCARAHLLLDAIVRSQPHMPEPLWHGRWKPVLNRLKFHWLPRFTARARDGAKRLNLPPMMLVVPPAHEEDADGDD